MITRLSVQDLAIIDQLSIQFSSGFNVITGETGAGKSILIRALHFLMGAKASADTIRQGADQASVTGEFLVPEEHPVLLSLSNLGIPYEVAGSESAILVRRQVSNKGRAQAWINDVPVALTTLREVGVLLVDVFGQHENQKLMDPNHHLKYVDDFLTDKSSPRRVEKLHRECSEEVRALEEKLRAFSEKDRNRDYLNYRREELKKFAPSQEDYLAVRRLCSVAGKQLESREKLVRALNLLEDENEDRSMAKSLREVSRILVQLAERFGDAPDSADLLKLSEVAETAASQTEELSFELGRRTGEWDVDEAELEAAEKREFGYHDLFRKFSVKEIDGLIEETDRLEREWSSLENVVGDVEVSLKSIQIKSVALKQAASELTDLRKKAAKKIKARIEAELHELSMPGAKLEIEFDSVHRQIPALSLTEVDSRLEKLWRPTEESLSQVGDSGAEKVQLLLSSNPGEALLPLSKVASGGELSRIMLAFKKALAADADTCVLVFDEIDTGISGRVADVVGAKLRDLAEGFQVICISHLPQVAVYADCHFLVEKVEKKHRTESTIVKLTSDQSAREIARLLSGAEVSAPSLVNAKSLMAKARGKKPVKKPGSATSART